MLKKIYCAISVTTMKKMKIFVILLTCNFVNINAENECKFQRPVKELYHASTDAETSLKIRFTLKRFDKFCIMKVKTADETFVTFNLTNRGSGNKSSFYGDKLREKMNINYNKKLLTITNSLKNNNGNDLSGLYQLNEKHFFVLPYKETTKQEVNGRCEPHGDKNVTINAMIEMNELFKLCFEYNTYFKNRSMQEFLECYPGICSSPFMENRFFNFTTFNKTQKEFTLTCKVWATKKDGTVTGGTEYSLVLKVVNNCLKPANHGIIALIIILTVLLILVLVLVHYNIRNKKETNKLRESHKPKCPEWGRDIFYERGLLSIYTEDPLGHGDFGIVYKAMTQQFGDPQSRSSPSSQLVAVKTYSLDSNQGHDDLHQEGELLSSLDYHPNIINLLAVSMDTPEFDNRVLLINELCTKGSILELLKRKREEFNQEGENWTEDFNPEVMTLWSFQISRGMEFLSMKNIVHGDLAARNILLDEHGSVKINDFGKAHKVNYDNIAVGVTGVQPLAWMAPEAIQNREISLLSDIWSYGVTLWELFSLGKHPYEERSFQEMVTDIHDGYRLPKPELCPGKIYSLMRNCWMEQPEQRPRWGDLTLAMEAMVESKYLDKYWKIEDASKMLYANIRNFSRHGKGDKNKMNKDNYDTPL